MSAGILIAAAGQGTRFIQAGGQGNKLNAKQQGSTVFALTLAQALATGLKVHVITRPDNRDVQHVCQSYNVQFTLLDSAGLGDTIAAGVAATQSWSGWLIHLADMPFVPVATFIQVSEALAEHSIVRPFYSCSPGHPVGFSDIWRADLLALTGDDGARRILAYHPARPLPVSFPAVIQDIDLPEHLFSSEAS
jgi:molybdenum cofactor cytidylyltransferase